MKFTRRVSCSDEFAGNVPEVLVVEIGPELAARIKELSAEVRRLGVYAIEVFDYSAAWYEADWDQETESSDDVPTPGKEFTGLDLNTLHVSSDDFWWEANLDGSSISISPEPISVTELPE